MVEAASGTDLLALHKSTARACSSAGGSVGEDIAQPQSDDGRAVSSPTPRLRSERICE